MNDVVLKDIAEEQLQAAEQRIQANLKRLRHLTEDERAAIKARQGVAFPMMETVTVVDGDGREVPRDGATQGEVAMRGNSVSRKPVAFRIVPIDA